MRRDRAVGERCIHQAQKPSRWALRLGNRHFRSASPESKGPSACGFPADTVVRFFPGQSSKEQFLCFCFHSASMKIKLGFLTLRTVTR
jgi:hypothetical protein